MTSYLYEYIYLLVCAIFLLTFLKRYRIPDIVFNNQVVSSVVNFIVIILTIFIGTRPVYVGSDTVQYTQHYQFILGEPFSWTNNAENLLFDNLFAFFGSLYLEIDVFFIVIAAIYFMCIAIATKKLFPQNQEIAFFSYLVAFSTYSYGTDGIKAGAGAAIFLVALAYRDRKALSILLALISIGFHHSMVVVVYAYIISYFYKNTKMYFYGWILATLIAIAHIGVFQEFFASYADDKGKDYLTISDGFMTGFRPDFILYSAMPVLVGYIMYIKRNVRDTIYELWLRMYLMTNSVWMLCMYASYTNRIAYLSWFMYPFVLLYPYLAMNVGPYQVKEGKIVVKYHMWFTIFMVVVYYGLLPLIRG